MFKNLANLIRDITRASAIQKKLGQATPLCENHILKSFTPDTIMLRPWSKLPNCKLLLIRSNRADVLLAQYGVEKKLTPELTFVSLNWKIKACNRYLRIMEYRLETLLRKQDSSQFWILALLLMRKSKVLRTLALRKLDINWYKMFSFPVIQFWMKQLNRKFQTLSKESFVIRHYVDKVKPDGSISWRPIGSPAYVDRMFLYLWQCFFVMFFTSYISSSQHAYLPGRGVNTATRELGNEIENSKWKYIWEFDLKGAFPSVHVPNTISEMTRRGLPHHIGSFLEGLALSTIERVDLSIVGRQLPEPKYDAQVAFGNLRPKFPAGENFGQHESAGQLLTGLISQTMHEAGEDVGDRLKRIFSEPDLNTLSPVDKDNNLTAVLNPSELVALDKAKSNVLVKGFPQGSGLSPILFNFAFETQMQRVHFSNKKYLIPELYGVEGDVKIISYADDFLFFSTHFFPEDMLKEMPFTPEDLRFNLIKPQIPWYLKSLPWEGMFNEIALLNQLETLNLGLTISKPKSFPIKLDGKWVKDSFKFIGQTIYLPGESRSTFVFEGTPRSGVKLEVSEEIQEMVHMHTRRDEALKAVIQESKTFKDMSPQELLDGWGLAKFPFNLLPPSLIGDAIPLTLPEIEAIDQVASLRSAEILAKTSTFEARITDDKAPLDDPTLVQKELPDHMRKTTPNRYRRDSKVPHTEYRGSEDDYQDGRHGRGGGPLSFVNSRLLGMIQNRIFSGTWESANEFIDRDLVDESKEGNSWLTLRDRSVFRQKYRSAPQWFRQYGSYASIFSCSSYSTLDLINYNRNPSLVKVKGGRNPAHQFISYK